MKTQEPIKQKRRLFNALLAKTHQMEAKEFILQGRGVQSTTELTERQLDELIEWAKGIYKSQQEMADKDIREWRHKCLRMMNECGVNTKDWSKVNAFMMDKRVAGKHLYELDVPELRNLHKKLHNISTNIKKKIINEMKLAQLN